MTLQEYYTQKTQELSLVAENGAYDIKLLICHALGMSENAFFMNMRLILTEIELEQLEPLINRRLKGEPLQYILGKWSFMGHDFYVDSSCLIPRQDTETLVEYALKEILRHNYSSVLDMCTGSGCIAISLSKGCGAKIIASDISTAAIGIAKRNAELNNAQVEFITADLFKGINGAFDVILANPPYLTKQEMDNVQRELKFEPYNALYGGVDGLDYYRRIAGGYSEHLNDGGMLLLEVGETQAQAVCDMFPQDSAKIITDLCGKERIVAVEKVSN